MSSSIDDYSPGGGLIFPSELEGLEFFLVDTLVWSFSTNGRGETTEQSGAEIPDDIEGQPKHGRWLYVKIDGDPKLMSAPGQLLNGLKDLDAAPGDTYRITKCEKTGDDQQAEYAVEVEKVAT